MAIMAPAQQWQAESPPCLGKNRNRTRSPRDSLQDFHRATGHKAWGLEGTQLAGKKKITHFTETDSRVLHSSIGAVTHMQVSVCLCVYDTYT